MKRASAGLVALLVAGMALAQIAGTKPGYLQEAATGIPNEQAIGQRIWAPGLEEGFVPQGVAVEGAHVLMSAYRSDYSKAGNIACRVFRVDAATGRDAGSFDLPDPCGHAGGMAYLGDGMLVVADTRQLWRIDLAKALASGNAQNALKGSVKLAGELLGSFTAFDGRDLWIGTYTRDAAKAKLYRLGLGLFDDHDGRGIRENLALEAIPIPVEAQGATFDAGGSLWVSTSSSMTGALHRLDRKTGAVVARHEMVIGIEGLAFDGEGRLWSVSESGARKYLSWSKYFPLLFAIDTAKLK